MEIINTIFSTLKPSEEDIVITISGKPMTGKSHLIDILTKYAPKEWSNRIFVIEVSN